MYVEVSELAMQGKFKLFNHVIHDVLEARKNCKLSLMFRFSVKLPASSATMFLSLSSLSSRLSWSV
jgi:hypothetical protein